MEAGTDKPAPQDAVRLRRWDEHDLDLLRRVNAPDMTAHLGGPESDDEVVARHAKYLRLWREGAARMFVIEVAGQATGTIGWWDTEHDGAPAAEAGWSVLPEFQRRGIAREALRLLTRDAATHSTHGLLVAYPGVDNAASNALCRSTGFTHTGSGVEPWRGGELAFHVWELDISDLDLTGRQADGDERFDAGVLDESRWWPHYLPHWSSRARSAARARVGEGGLALTIDEHTPPWAPEWDGDVRVSHVQTGQVSGPVGGAVGQHRFRDDLVVREQQPERRLWLPRFGVIEVRMAAIAQRDAMVACWPIGVEDRPEESGEICLAEIFGSEIDRAGGAVGLGVKAHHDPRLRTDFEKIRVAGDLTRMHDYAVEWMPESIRFFVDGRWVKTVPQRIDYPVQIMLGVFELPHEGADRDTSALPLAFRVERVRTFPLR